MAKLRLFLPWLLLLTGCSDGNNNFSPQPPPPPPDFSSADAIIERFVAENPGFDGASYVLVDRSEGPMHEAAFGDHTLETVILLASTSKMPAASLMMALAEDENLDFDIDVPVENYLPWLGVWPGATAENLVSNLSGIPGLQYLEAYAPHICQFAPLGQLQECGQLLYETPLSVPGRPPDTEFDYGGSQWQIAGTVAEVVGGASWGQLFDQYLADPCDLEIFRYGNMFSVLASWDGNPDSLLGLDNPNIEGGAMSNLDDYARILSMQLNEGRCGDQQVLSPEAVAFMREDRGSSKGSREWTVGEDSTSSGWGYGMGWWVVPRDESSPYLYLDPGAFGAIAWIDLDRQYGGYVQLEDLSLQYASEGTAMVVLELIPQIEALLDRP